MARVMIVASLALLAAAFPTRDAAAQSRTPIWLDAPLRAWNVPAGGVPAIPADASSLNPLDRCRAAERPPQGAEEGAVAAAGWRLNDFWPSQRAPGLVLVTANAGYDGMCRPALFNVFAFSDGRFAGTLAPGPMFPREDGVLFDVPLIRPDGTIEATYVRYAATDPLCCPSLPASLVTYRLQNDTAGPVVVASRVVVALRLPATGLGDGEPE